MRLLAALLAVVLLVSGVLAPSVEAASLATPGCAPARAEKHACCCHHAASERCPCEVAPATPRPQPVESAPAPAGAQRPVLAAAPAVVVVASPRIASRAARTSLRAPEGLRLHLRFSVLLE